MHTELMGSDERARREMNVTATMDADELTNDLRSFWRSELRRQVTCNTSDLKDFLQFVSGDHREALRVLQSAGRIEMAGVVGDHVFRLFDLD